VAYKILGQFADTVGDGSGTINAIGDYDTTSELFMITAGVEEHIIVTRCITSFTAAAITKADVYGDGTALPNGIVMFVMDKNSAIQYYLTDQNAPIKTNTDWAQLCFDFAVFTGFATGDDFLVARWTFEKSGKPVELLPGWSLAVLLQDDFSILGLTEHNFFMHGYFERPRIGGVGGHA